eukprot:6208817-Pleurochrysis_carterae.AAC.2
MGSEDTKGLDVKMRHAAPFTLALSRARLTQCFGVMPTSCIMIVVKTDASSFPLRCCFRVMKRTSRVCTCEKEAGHQRATRQSASPRRVVPSKANETNSSLSSFLTFANSIFSTCPMYIRRCDESVRGFPGCSRSSRKYTTRSSGVPEIKNALTALILWTWMSVATEACIRAYAMR